MRIQNNVSALNALNNVSKNENKLTSNIKKLSSGYKINSAADDAAGLAISEKMRSQIRGLGKAIQNANDGVSAAETAEGSMQEVTNILQRMRELAVQATNSGTYSTTQLGDLNKEFTALNNEIDRIAASATYNGTSISGGKFSFMVDADGKQAITMNVKDFKGLTSGLEITDATKAQTAIGTLDTKLQEVTSARADIGAVVNRLDYTVNNLTTMKENITQAESRIRDVNMAKQMVSYSKDSILQQAGQSMLAQANQSTQGVLSLLR